jgi:hypothetical protein
MPPGKLTALAGGAGCLRRRHRLTADKTLHTAQDGTRERHYWCNDPACGRYQVAVASRPA